MTSARCAASVTATTQSNARKRAIKLGIGIVPKSYSIPAGTLEVGSKSTGGGELWEQSRKIDFIREGVLLLTMDRRLWLKMCVGLGLGAWLADRRLLAAPASPRRLVLQPLGPALPSSDVEFVKRSLLTFYDFDLVIAESQPLPKKAYYPPRQRYRAEKLLEYLHTLLPQGAERIIGLTSVDISTTKGAVFDWGIMGLATIEGQVSVLSSFRCRRKVHTVEQGTIRFGKVAVHEMGHSLGLDHCKTQGCIMHDGEGSATTVDGEYDLCARCRTALSRDGRLNPAASAPPWPKP